MNKFKYIIMALAVAAGFSSCSDDDGDPYPGGNGPVTVNKVYLEDNSDDATVAEREVTFARLGQTLRLEGSGFGGTRKVYVNGYETYFNTTYVTDRSMILVLQGKTPVSTAPDSVRNKIQFVKDSGTYTYDFIIRAAAPQITSVDNTLPQPGETVVVHGINLQETSKVTLPGGVEVTDITNATEEDEDGEWFSFVMPQGVTESGSITSEGANGTAISAKFFNNNDCYIINFDGKGTQGGWSATYRDTDLVDDPLGTGRGKVAMLVPQCRLDEGGVKAGVSNIPGYWTAGNDDTADDWNRMKDFIPGETPVSELALQFDVYVPEPWNLTGQMEITLQNNLSNWGYGSDCTKPSEKYTNQATVWIPWLQSDGTTKAFTTGDRWVTVTIPLTKFGNYSGDDDAHTFQNLIDDRNSGSYRNFGFMFVNSDIVFNNDLTISALDFSQKIYVDNFRIVPNKSTIVSDYPEE